MGSTSSQISSQVILQQLVRFPKPLTSGYICSSSCKTRLNIDLLSPGNEDEMLRMAIAMSLEEHSGEIFFDRSFS